MPQLIVLSLRPSPVSRAPDVSNTGLYPASLYPQAATRHRREQETGGQVRRPAAPLRRRPSAPFFTGQQVELGTSGQESRATYTARSIRGVGQLPCDTQVPAGGKVPGGRRQVGPCTLCLVRSRWLCSSSMLAMRCLVVLALMGAAWAAVSDPAESLSGIPGCIEVMKPPGASRHVCHLCHQARVPLWSAGVIKEVSSPPARHPAREMDWQGSRNGRGSLELGCAL